jgi:hypothetical protein
MSNHLLRRYRRIVAATLTGVLIFGGLITAAHGCTIASPAPATLARHAIAPTAANPAVVPAMPDCADEATPSDASTSACATYCITVQSLEVQTHPPAALAASGPALRISVPERAVASTDTARLELSSIGGAPPPLLRFARRLI